MSNAVPRVSAIGCDRVPARHRRRAAMQGLVATLVLASCSAYRPQPPAEPTFRARAESQTHGSVTVRVAALGAAESKQYFGVDLASRGIQPVWLQIENHGDTPLYLLLSSIDPAYFSAREAAYQAHSLFDAAGNERMDEFFESQSIDSRVPVEKSRSGFVFTNLDEGAKYLTVQLYGPDDPPLFYFLVDVPGISIDYQQVDFDRLRGFFVDLDNKAQLRAALEALPACTTRPDGGGRGDPLNFVVIGTSDEIGATLVASGWQVTEALGAGSGWRTFKSFLLGRRYRYSPMSALYVFGRSQDAGFQKARGSVHQRNHLRIWLTPLRYHDADVWIGTISRDIGVYFTTRAWSLTTHAIDPDLDEAREALVEDLILSQAVNTFGYVDGGGGEAPRERPQRNLMGAPYWTDGLRAVFILGEEATGLNDVKLLQWQQRGRGRRPRSR